jgi:hypothetical protein
MAKKPKPKPIIAGLRFQMSNKSAEKKIEKSVAKLVTNLKKETKETVREVILDGYKKGLHPNSIALDIAGRINMSTGKRQGGVVGMSRPQAEASRNFRERLESGEPAEMSKVLDMKLRDKRFDGTIEKAIAEAKEKGKPVILGEDKIDSMVDRYVNSSLRLRGETIARTETMSAVNAGSLESFEQALDKSEFSEKAVTRTWRTSGGANVRDSHLDMEGQVVEGLDEPFVSGLGNELMQPGDTSLGAGAEDVCNCACDVEIDIDFTEGVT